MLEVMAFMYIDANNAEVNASFEVRALSRLGASIA
jgi:hypothetical protein